MEGSRATPHPTPIHTLLFFPEMLCLPLSLLPLAPLYPPHSPFSSLMVLPILLHLQVIPAGVPQSQCDTLWTFRVPNSGTIKSWPQGSVIITEEIIILPTYINFHLRNIAYVAQLQRKMRYRADV